MLQCSKPSNSIYEPPRGKTNNLHMRKEDFYPSSKIRFNKRLTIYEGRSESSNNCLIIQLIFIVKQKESYLI